MIMVHLHINLPDSHGGRSLTVLRLGPFVDSAQMLECALFSVSASCRGVAAPLLTDIAPQGPKPRHQMWVRGPPWHGSRGCHAIPRGDVGWVLPCHAIPPKNSRWVLPCHAIPPKDLGWVLPYHAIPPRDLGWIRPCHAIPPRVGLRGCLWAPVAPHGCGAMRPTIFRFGYCCRVENEILTLHAPTKAY